jgi:hypothetical protein
MLLSYSVPRGNRAEELPFRVGCKGGADQVPFSPLVFG